MRWRGRRESDNIEDRRAEGGTGGFGFPFPGRGRGMRFPGAGSSRARKGGIGGIGLLVVLGLMLLFGVDPTALIRGVQETQSPSGRSDIRLPRSSGETRTGDSRRRSGGRIRAPRSGSADELKRFVAVVLADTEDVWNAIFRKHGRSYREPKLVLFSGSTRSGCGQGQAAMGPFYCPLDRKVYIDLSFYQDLRKRFRAPGDFAQAYVVAHEIGHHVQTLLGISEQVQKAKRGMSRADANALQVRMELQADCLAGIWANIAQRTKRILEPGDIDEALGAASAIGDDRIQKRTQGYVVPDAFTHGSSEQRVRWFKRGLASGDLQQCDTFNAERL